MSKLVKVGIMPGRITEVAVELGQSIASVIELAGLDSEGYEVKVDGETVNAEETTIQPETNLILLVRQVKGN